MTDDELVPYYEHKMELARPAFDGRSTFEVLPDVVKLSEALSRSNFVPEAYRGKPAELTAVFLAGHELGIMPMTAMLGIDSIKGRPAISARLMRALVTAAGHDIWFEEKTITRVTMCGHRREWPADRVAKVTWTKDDADRAKLNGKDNWQQYPRAMLAARCTGELVRDNFADVVAGLAYTAEELEVGFDEADGQTDEAPIGDETTTTTRRAKKTTGRKAAAPRKAARTSGSGGSTTGDTASRPPEPPLPGDEDDVVDLVDDGTGTLVPEGDIDAENIGEDVTPPSDVDERLKKLRQRIAIAAGELDVDRSEVIYAVVPPKTGARELNETECELVVEALRRMKTGEVRLEENDAGESVLVDAAPVDNADSGPSDEAPEEEVVDPLAFGAEVDWGQDEWIAYLRSKGIRMVPTLKKAKSLAVEMQKTDPNVKVPVNLGELKGNGSLAALVRAEVEGDDA